MNRYLKTQNKKACCGCGACERLCPKNCLRMVEDDEGFYYPLADRGKCSNCGLCATICPMERLNLNKISSFTAYAAYSKNKELISKSSSGGIFPVLATAFLKDGGIVFGAYLDDRHKLYHVGINSLSLLNKVMGSKYIQSNIGNTFAECRSALENNKKILFTGTPCQIQAIRNYLGKEYDNLYTADVICHGVPSQKIFDAYVDFLEQRHKARLVDIDFRDKERNGWSITLRYTMENDKGKKHDYYLLSSMSEYFSGFLGGYILRESCYQCPFASIERPGDLTMGDFWGYQKTRPDLRHDEGLSLLLVNSEKGKELINTLKLNNVVLNPVDELNVRQSENKNLYRPTFRPGERDTIYNELNEFGFDYIARKHLRSNFTFKNRIKNLLPAAIIRALKGVGA